MPAAHKDIVILYHGGCPDGFGSAYAAWKKYGDAADYIPVRYQQPLTQNLEGKEIYMIDFCYDQVQMNELLKMAKSLTVLDHHEGIQAVVESMPNHVYDTSRSGASIAWGYFHPTTPLPTFLKYVEDVDLFRMIPEEERALMRYAYAQVWHFDIWDAHVRNTDDPVERARMIERGTVYQEYFKLLSKQLANGAELVEFEGYTCHIVNGVRMFITDLGAELVKQRPPISLVVRAGASGLRVSIRSDGSVNAAELAQRHGGGGHPGSAAFSLPWGAPIPWIALQANPEN
ncbi:MAG: hypothetical protein JWN18_167 [Parcubacteria group bacterium]|nr:hypothetical protein [Parcubacteria group bacterium]